MIWTVNYNNYIIHHANIDLSTVFITSDMDGVLFVTDRVNKKH